MVRIGVICPSEIALRRFMPALKKASNFEFVGISSYSAKERFGDAEEYTKEQLDKVASGMKKAEVFVEQYGGRIFESFEELCSSGWWSQCSKSRIPCCWCRQEQQGSLPER